MRSLFISILLIPALEQYAILVANAAPIIPSSGINKTFPTMLIVTTANEEYIFHSGLPAAAMQLEYIRDPAPAMIPGSKYRKAGKAAL